MLARSSKLETDMSENRLGQETSPYLLQHQENPVHWWAWGPEALAHAKRTGKPILLSVGYAARHWWHRMAPESRPAPRPAPQPAIGATSWRMRASRTARRRP